MTHSILQIEKFPGIICKGHNFDVPLDYNFPAGPHISIYAREVVADENYDRDNLPYLVFLQGGPGMPSPRPESNEGWLR